MTGLDVENDSILEMACIITDSDLNIVAEVSFNWRFINSMDLVALISYLLLDKTIFIFD